MKSWRAMVVALCAIASGWAAGPARADNPIKMVVESPLSRVNKPLKVAVQSGRWFALAVTLSNQGDEVSGTLAAQLTSDSAPDKAPDEFKTSVDLPTNSHKRVWLYVRFDHDDLDICRVTLNGRGIQSLKSDVALEKMDNSSRLIVTVSDEGEKLSYLSGFKGSDYAYPSPPASQSGNPNVYAGPSASGTPGTNNSSANPLIPMGCPHELIPTRWVGLDAVDVLVLRDFDQKTLTAEQLEALRGYVAAGGTIFVFGGADWQGLASSPLQDLWPVQLTGSSPASQAETNLLIDQYFRARHKGETGDAGDRLGGAPILVARGAPRPDSQTLCGGSGSTLMALQPYGAGQVVFLAVDPTQPPFLGWRGLDEVWSTIVGHAPGPHRLEGVDPNAVYASLGNNNYGNYSYYHPDEAPVGPTGGILSALNKSPELHTPPVSYIAWFLALYVFFLVPVNYCVLRYFDKRELAWVTVPVIVVAFSVMSYTAALSIKGRVVRTRQIDIVQGATDSGLARADSMLWLFSPRKTSYDMVSDNPEMAVANYYKDDKDPNVVISEPDQNTAITVEDASVLMWDWRNFVANGVVNVGNGVHIDIQNGKPVLHNGTRYDISGAALVVGTHVYPFDSVKAGATDSPGASAESVAGSNAQVVQSLVDHAHFERLATGETTYDELAKAALAVAIGDQKAGAPAAYVVGWSGQPVADLQAQGETPHEQNLTLFFFRCPDTLKLQRLASRPGEPLRLDSSARLVSREPLSTYATLKTNPSARLAGPGERFEFVCDLPSSQGKEPKAVWSKMDVTVRGRGRNASLLNSMRLGIARPMPGRITLPPAQPLAKAEVWNAATDNWQPVQLQFNTTEKSLDFWTAKAQLGSDLLSGVNQDELNQVRIAIETVRGDVGVNAVRVRATAGLEISRGTQ